MDSANDPIMKRARSLAQNLYSVQSVMRIILYDLRVPLNCQGFDYLTKVVQAAVDRGDTHIVAAELYEAVCEPGVKPKSIEIAIRAAIKTAWEIRLVGIWHFYFPEYIVDRRKPPSNLEFITAIVYFVLLWQDCCEKEAECYASV